MATSSVPVFHSLNQLVGSMVSSFLSELDTKGIVPGIQSLKPGSPYLAIFEAVGQSQFRGQEQTLSLLDANDLDQEHGERLDRIGVAERLPRRGATFASGLVNLSDTGFTKITSRVYQGKAAPIPGSTTIYVADATLFTATGSVFLGRGTPNLEGPLTYNAKANVGAYWTITLTAPTTNFHGLGETVTLAQGGDRIIATGQVVGTPVGNQGTAATFVTTSSATILDGETLIANVPVSSQVPGADGNASAAGIKVVTSPAFAGLAVTNPLPITNGQDVENDDLYRERIKAARRSRYGVGTTLGLNVFSYGVKAPDESATVISSQYVNRSTLPSLLVIDDGTGYEAKDSGIAYEVVMDSAVGGEDIFFLNHGQPVAKASLLTVQAAPYALSDQATLTVKVGGVTYTHTFVVGSFGDITNATAYEVTASINSNPVIPFSARTTGAGTYVAIFAKANVNDDIEVIATPAGTDANLALLFPGGRVDALRLYKNDYLLSKDGQIASLASNDQTLWTSMVSGETLIVSVDGTPYSTYTFTDADAIALGLGYATLTSTLPLSAWASIFNAKVPGVTCTVSGGGLVFTSNLGLSVRASVSIDPSCSMSIKGLFNALALTAQGRGADYVLDRNRGQIDLTYALVAGDKLTAGTSFTRGYIQSISLGATVTVPVGGLNLWLTVDGTAVAVPHTLNASHQVHQYWTATDRAFWAWSGAAFVPCFTNVQVGDMAIWSQDAWGGFGGAPVTYSMMRVSSVDPAGTWFKCDYATAGAGNSLNDPTKSVFNRLYFVRTIAVPQQIGLAAGVYTQAQLVAAILPIGATASIQTSHLRLTTNTYASTGDIALSAQDLSAASTLGFLVGSAIQSDEPEAAAVQSGNSEIGTPNTVESFAVASFTPPLTIGSTLANVSRAKSGFIEGALWLLSKPTVTVPSWGTNAGDKAEWTSTAATNPVLDHLLAPARPAIDLMAITSRFRVGPLSSLSVVFDSDPVTKGYTVPMTRWLKVDAAVPYGASLRLTDGDNLVGGVPQSLASAFGTTFDFSNFALHAHGRSRFDLSATQPGSTDTLLLRLKSWCGRDDTQHMTLRAPLTASATLSVKNVLPLGDVSVYLASGAARAITFTVGDGLLMAQSGAGTATTLVSAFALTSIVRAGATVTVTLTQPTATVTSSYLAPAGVVYVNTTDVNFPSGLKTIVGVATTIFTNDTFTYTEAGAAVGGSVVGAYVSKQATPTDFTGAVVGDLLSLPASSTAYWTVVDALSDSVSRLRVTAIPVATPLYWVEFAATTLTSAWKTVVAATDLSFYPLTANTTNAVLAAINALATSSVTATLAGGPGTGVISQVDGTLLQAIIADSTLHISSAAYNVGVLNYDITLKLAPDATLAAVPNDWANEEFRLAPTTSKNVADYLNRGQVTGLASTGASIQASSSGHRVQLATGTLGSLGAVQVAGGTANDVRFTVLQGVNSGTAISASVVTTDNIETISNRAYAILDNAVALPKILDWTAATTLTAATGVVTVGVAGSAWTFPVDPSFGTQWLWDNAGKFQTVYPAINAPTLTGSGAWVHFEPGLGKWKVAGARTVAVVGASYVTLNDGRVLAIGGLDRHNLATGAASNAVEAYTPSTDSWAAMAVLPAARAFGAAVKLASGKVLFAGGLSTGALAWHTDAYVYDPSTNLWTAVGVATLNVARSHHTMTVMSTGEVLVVGGATTATTFTNTLDIYNLDASACVAGPTMAHARGGHHAQAYGSDQLLVIGGAGGAGTGYETFSLPAVVWMADTAFGIDAGATRIGHAVVALSPASFLVAGGSTAEASVDANTWTNPKATCEIYDTSTNTVVAASSMQIPRSAASGAAIPNGLAIVWGGLAALPSVGAPAILAQRSVEVFTTTTGTWGFASATINPHLYAPALLVSGSEVIISESTSTAGVASTATDKYDSSLLAAPAGNIGTFRLLNVSTERLMVEAPNAQPGLHDYGYVAFYTYNSVLPNDSLRVSSAVLGTAPQGNYKVLSVDLYNRTKFTIEGGASWVSGALGTSLPLVTVLAEKPSRMLYNVRSVVTDDLHVGQTVLGLLPVVNAEHFSAVAGSVLTLQDKLSFPTTLVPGQDGYRYNTGLIAEVTRVIYGDERDVVTYPGVASAGAAIDVSAPLIRRIIVSLAIRARSGAVDVVARVQAAVAKVVNSATPGPIDISSVSAAVREVDGVTSVVMLSPVATTSADTIPVQPHEKALILDPSNDVLVSFIGA